jgi:hypothetical protein
MILFGCIIFTAHICKKLYCYNIKIGWILITLYHSLISHALWRRFLMYCIPVLIAYLSEYQVCVFYIILNNINCKTYYSHFLFHITKIFAFSIIITKLAFAMSYDLFFFLYRLIFIIITFSRLIIRQKRKN